MAGRRTQPPRPPVRPPVDAGDGAARVRDMLVKLFDRKDGTGADWPLMLESLFRAGFHITDGRPDDDARQSIMRRVHEASYSRMTGDSEAMRTGLGDAGATPSNTAGPREPGPRPPR